MYFIITNKYNWPMAHLKTKTFISARRVILMARLNADDRKMDEFLKENYKTNLRQICLKIISSAKYMADPSTKNVIVRIVPENLEKLARLITYGNGKINGSTMLKNAFNI